MFLKKDSTESGDINLQDISPLQKSLILKGEVKSVLRSSQVGILKESVQYL